MTTMKRLTVAAVEKRVEQIRAMAGDDEGAHSAEDGLHTDVLRAIATGAPNAAALAAAALATERIEFARWYA